MRVMLPRSKTDQEGRGQAIAIPAEPNSPYCLVQALKDWLTVADITSGPVFLRMRRGDHIGATAMTAKGVAMIIKACVATLGLEPGHFAGHSLRRGFLTAAARDRKNLFKLAQHSRHRSLETVREYVEDAGKFDDHAGKGLLAGATASAPASEEREA